MSPNKYVAERNLFFSEKSSSDFKRLRIRVSAPSIARQEDVSFPVDGTVAVCHVQLDGLEQFSFDVYGMDSLQAINMASDIEALLKRLSTEYDFFWSSGEPYFE